MDDLNVDHYNIDDIFELVDVQKYDFEELIEVLDVYAEAYTKENNIILTNFILQIKSKVTDYIQSIGFEYNTDSIKQLERNDEVLEESNDDTDEGNINSILKNAMDDMEDTNDIDDTNDTDDPVNSIINIAPRLDTPESNLEYLEEGDDIYDENENENEIFTYNPNETMGNDLYSQLENNSNNNNSMPNFTQALEDDTQQSSQSSQSLQAISGPPTTNQEMTKPLNQFEEDYIEKVLIFNSEFRKPSESINDYLIDMAEPLQNVTALQLTSYTLTNNIYNIDEANTTNVLYMTDSRFNEHTINIKSGFYTSPEQIIAEINTNILNHFTNDASWNSPLLEDSIPFGTSYGKIRNADDLLIITNEDLSGVSGVQDLIQENYQPVTFEYDSLNGKVCVKVKKPERHPKDATDGNPNYRYPNHSRTGPFIMYITFFSLSQGSTLKYNFNLGYFLGFRRFFLNSTKGIGYYVEFKNDQDTEGQTDTNNDAISNVFESYDASTDTSFNLIESEGLVDIKHPKYLMLSLDEFNQNRTNSNVIQVNDGTNNTIRDMMSRLEIPKNPRQRPLAHIYAHNERIIGNMNELRKQRIRNYPQTIPDTFADIPFPSEISLGTIINNQGQNTASIPPRKYFGPINIKRFRVRLFDEKGNLVNLNNTDYTFSVKLKMLYNNNLIKQSPIESLNIDVNGGVNGGQSQYSKQNNTKNNTKK